MSTLSCHGPVGPCFEVGQGTRTYLRAGPAAGLRRPHANDRRRHLPPHDLRRQPERAVQKTRPDVDNRRLLPGRGRAFAASPPRPSHTVPLSPRRGPWPPVWKIPRCAGTLRAGSPTSYRWALPRSRRSVPAVPATAHRLLGRRSAPERRNVDLAGPSSNDLPASAVISESKEGGFPPVRAQTGRPVMPAVYDVRPNGSIRPG